MLDWGLGFLGGLLNFARDPVGAVAGWTFDNVTEGIYEWLARGLAFAPLVFSASVLPVMRDSARRLIHLLVALVVSKLAIVISLVVAVQLAANAGAAETGGADTDAAAAVGTLVTGFACFLVAAISPMVLYRLMPTVEGAVASAGVVGGWGRAALSVGQAAVMAKGLGAAAAATRAVAGQRGGAGGLGRQQGAAGQRGGGGPESSGSPRVTGLAAATRAATSGQVASGSAGSQDRGATDGNLPPLPDAEPRGGAAPWVAPGRARRGLAHRRAALHHQHRRGRWCGSERARRRGRWASTSTGGPTAGQAVGTSRCACIGRQAGRHRKGLRVGGGRTVSTTARSYTFGDASPPGILLGLPMRQAVPVVAGVLWLAVCLQTPLGIAGGLVGPLAGATVAFGRWRGSALVETVGPATRIALGRRTDRARWHRPPLLGTTGGGPVAEALPPALAGLELIDALPESDELTGRRAAGMAAVRDRRRHTLTAAIQVTGRGFPLAAGEDQDRMLAGWGAALSPLARDRSPVIRVVWQAWAGPADMSDHHEFLATTGATARAQAGDTAAGDYIALVDEQAPATRAQRVVVTVTPHQLGGAHRRGTRRPPDRHRGHPRRAHRRPSWLRHSRHPRLPSSGLSVAARLANRAERDGLAIVAVVDADPAGQRWARRLHELLAEHDHTPTIIEPALGKDLNDWACRDPCWVDQLSAPVPLQAPPTAEIDNAPTLGS